MATEIERKFLVATNEYLIMAKKKRHIIQGYLSVNPDATVRIRIDDSKAYITIKGRNHGAVRAEWEYDIPMDDAKEMINRLCRDSIIDKTRYVVDYGAHCWEIDEFHSPHNGLVIAEVELASADEPVEIPPFIGSEVTGDPSYYNSNLSKPTCNHNRPL